MVVWLILGLISFGKIFKHLLRILIRLEFLVLIIYFLLGLKIYNSLSLSHLLIVYLIFRVCEGALGLTILVAMARRFGGDYLRRFRLGIML